MTLGSNLTSAFLRAYGNWIKICCLISDDSVAQSIKLISKLDRYDNIEKYFELTLEIACESDVKVPLTPSHRGLFSVENLVTCGTIFVFLLAILKISQ